MKIALTGSTGFLGKELLIKLESRANEVIEIGRNENKKNINDYIYVSGIDSSTQFNFGAYTCELLIHCAARVHIMNDGSNAPLDDYREVNTIGTLNLARQAVESGVKRFIFISSIKVNGESTGSNKPFKSTDERHPEDYYGQSKSEAEEQLLQLSEETGLEVVIIRPTLVYGPGVKANFLSLMNLVSKGLPLPFGCMNNNKRSLVSVHNLVDLIVTCIDHPKAANQVFLVSDDYDVSTSEIVREMAKSLSKPEWQLPVPVWCYKLVGKLTGKLDVIERLTGSLQVDIQHTKETLDWVPPQSLEDGLKETANYILDEQGKN